jgi:hypothetical protein
VLKIFQHKISVQFAIQTGENIQIERSRHAQRIIVSLKSACAFLS